MATSFPTGLDALTNPSSTDSQDNPSHSSQHANANDAVEALQAKVGVDGSAVVTSLDHLVKAAEAPGHTHDAAYLTPAEGNAAYAPLGAARESAVITFEGTTSTAFTDLATVGPSVTVTPGSSGLLLVVVEGWMRNATSAESAQMGFSLSGGNTLAAHVDRVVSDFATNYVTASMQFLVTGLAATATTVKAEYRATGVSTAEFGRRRVIAIPL